MRDQQQRASVKLTGESLLEYLLGAIVHRIAWLIEQQHRWLLQVGARDGDCLPLTAGQAFAAFAHRHREPERVAIDLSRGRGRFEVEPRPERLFSVHAGDVTVTVIGTVFTVERVADRIGVTVSRGKVLVEWGVGSRTLGAGESGWFPPLVVGQTGAAVAPPAFRSAPAPAAPVGKKARQKLARAERTEQANDAAAEETAKPAPPPAGAPETAESLLAAADAARLQGRAQDGAALLRKIVQEHRSDPRAPLAAFTLGRVLLPLLLRQVAERSVADAAGPALASMLVYLLMALVLALRPHGLFPARRG